MYISISIYVYIDIDIDILYLSRPRECVLFAARHTEA